jgi:NAD(P)-dependent dehydrogenase (short-subunit alcohol dehydrogenase family)
MAEWSGIAPVAVVTGAGSGIGRSVALALVRARYRVALAGRRAEALTETARLAGIGRMTETAQPAGPVETLAVPTDVTSAAAVEALFDAVVRRWGRVDLLFNNAGMGSAGAVDEVTPEQWQQVVNVNLTGSYLCAHHAVRTMKEQQPRGGRIINNGSRTPRPSTPSPV